MKQVVALLLFVLASSLACAGPGHDHDAPAAGGGGAPALPRMEAHSELFELVGVVQRGKLTLFLDRYNDNEPVTDAAIELETTGFKGAAKALPDGTYELDAPFLEKAGSYPFTFTVAARGETDLLAAELTIADTHADHDHASSSWLTANLRYSAIVGVLLVATLLAWVAIRVRKARR
jgi:membrane fusion protein, heavy metal efflux system